MKKTQLSKFIIKYDYNVPLIRVLLVEYYNSRVKVIYVGEYFMC